MKEEVPLGDLLFTHLPTAIDRLRSHDAHCSFEVAALLECALDVLRAPNAIRAYDSITATIAELAITLPQRHGDTLPEDTRYFLGVVGDDYCAAFDRRGQQEILAALDGPATGKEQASD